ncbi:hypothetical protein LOD99_11247, partial [Oopsacas minuta]
TLSMIAENLKAHYFSNFNIWKCDLSTEKERRTNKALLRNHLSSYLVADRVGHLLGKKSEDLKKSLLTRGLKLGMNGCIKDDHLNR